MVAKIRPRDFDRGSDVSISARRKQDAKDQERQNMKKIRRILWVSLTLFSILLCSRSTADNLEFGSKTLTYPEYDKVVIHSISDHWWKLLDGKSYQRNKGKAVLTFRLNSDGTVQDIKVEKTTVPDLLVEACRRAVLDAAPFKPWPEDMKQKVGKDYRVIRFAFYFE
jgi:hypothetical protein